MVPRVRHGFAVSGNYQPPGGCQSQIPFQLFGAHRNTSVWVRARVWHHTRSSRRAPVTAFPRHDWLSYPFCSNDTTQAAPLTSLLRNTQFTSKCVRKIYSSLGVCALGSFREFQDCDYILAFSRLPQLEFAIRGTHRSQ